MIRLTDQSFDLEKFFQSQLQAWPETANRYADLERCERKVCNVRGQQVKVQFNPARIRSCGAKLDVASIAARPCFLCDCNRPAEQMAVDLGDYQLLVNPFPIFSRHFTIPAKEHTPQAIAGRMEDMLRLARLLDGMTVFYNGPHSGASAPDHFHFQAVPTGELPFWQAEQWPWGSPQYFEGDDAAVIAGEVEAAIARVNPGQEPDMNIYARSLPDGRRQAAVIYRAAHRPANYGPGEGQTLISPASAEMAGVIVAPRQEDFDYCNTPERIDEILTQCGAPSKFRCEEVTLRVGIVNAEEIKVDFNGSYTSDQLSAVPENLHLRLENGRISCEGRLYDGLLFSPASPADSFTLRDVMIGIGFHWQQHEDQSFHGSLLVKIIDGRLLAINIVEIETYLRSVVSSEMNAEAPEEFLKAHAVISRSWVIAQINPPHHLDDHSMTETAEETIKWYDRDAHTGFDVCADDHCQRYQGCTKASTPQVEAALQATRGQVLAYGDELCDARFSKCCGGVTELFSTCWQPVDLPYLKSVDDPFCGRASKRVLSYVLNNYDQTTTDYYRWRVEYTADELADIIRRRTGFDYGRILDIRPLHRGPSGRIDRLEIRGTELTRVIGKELEIRRSLSESHLYSSAFDVSAHDPDADGVPQRWVLTGSGWGHGVGLCQIGAAVMADEGYDYIRILKHYFPGSRLVNLY